MAYSFAYPQSEADGSDTDIVGMATLALSSASGRGLGGRGIPTTTPRCRCGMEEDDGRLWCRMALVLGWNGLRMGRRADAGISIPL